MNLAKTLIPSLAALSISFSATADTKAIDQLNQSLDKNSQAVLQNLNRVIESDSSLRTKFKILQTELESIAKSTASPKVKLEQHRKEVRKFQIEKQAAYKLAGFNSEAYYKKQESLVAKYNSKSKKKALFFRKGDMSFQLIEAVDFNAPTEAAEIVLSAPFPLDEHRMEGRGDFEPNAELGKYRVTADGGFFQNFTNRGGLAHFFEVPGGARRIRISARVPEASSFVFAFGVLGWGMGKSSSQIIIEGENGQLCEDSKLIQALNLYFLDSEIVESSTSHLLACEFDAPPAGQEVVIKFFGRATVDSNLASPFASTNGNPEAIRIRLNPAR